MKAWVAAVVGVVLSATWCFAQEVVITSVEEGGVLEWSAPSGTVCTVEWTGDPASTNGWRRTWNPVNGMLMTGTNASAEVPMMYRIMCDTNPLEMVTPYVREVDMHWVRQAYSVDTNCPWEFEHDGIDFEPASNLAPFRAVCDGRIMEVAMRHAPPVDGGRQNWDVYIMLRYNDDWQIAYNFEPKTTNLVDGVTQMTNIVVSLLQEVSQGDVIGYLHMADPSAHVHFNVIKNGYSYHNGVVVCPEPFFTQPAQESVIRLITNRHANAGMCY